jgi:surfeit locus 1 family protein
VTSPFRGRWLLSTILIIVLTIIFLVLGSWQLQRRSQRLAANAHVLARLEQPTIGVTGEALDPVEADLRRGTVRGVFDYDQEIVLRNRTWNELPGVHVLVPLRISGSDGGSDGGSDAADAILVDRGWIPYDAAAPADRAVFHNAIGEVEVSGVLRTSQVRRGSISPADPTPTQDKRVDAWHRVDLPKIRQQLPYRLLDVYLEEDVRPGETPRAFPKPQPDIRLDEGSHLVYAVQWFAFALIAVSGYATYYAQRTRPSGAAAKVRPLQE